MLAPLLRLGTRASANCLHLLEGHLSFKASSTLLFHQVWGQTLPLSLSSFSVVSDWYTKAVETTSQTLLWLLYCWVYEKMPCKFTLDKKSCLIHKLIIWECHNNKLWLLNLFQKWCQDQILRLLSSNWLVARNLTFSIYAENRGGYAALHADRVSLITAPSFFPSNISPWVSWSLSLYSFEERHGPEVGS